KDKHTPNVARCLHWETVRVDGIDDDLWNCVRQGLQLELAEKSKLPVYDDLYKDPYVYGTRTLRSSMAGMSLADSDEMGSDTSKSRISYPNADEASDTDAQCTDKQNIAYNRFRKRFIFAPLGTPLCHAADAKALLRALHGG